MFHETFNSDSISSEQSPDSLCSGESDAQETQSVAKEDEGPLVFVLQLDSYKGSSRTAY